MQQEFYIDPTPIDDIAVLPPIVVFIITSQALPFHLVRIAESVNCGHVKKFGIVHLSEENLDDASTRELYASRACSWVLRHYYDPRLEKASPLVTTIPLFPSAFIHKKPSKKEYTWSFAGNPNKTDRKHALSVFSSLVPNKVHFIETWQAANSLAKKEYCSLLSSSKFVLCPTGNINLDTIRLYEVLEANSVPVVMKSSSFQPFDYWTSLLGEVPFLVCESWEDARSKVESFSDEEYLFLQSRVQNWWTEVKNSLKQLFAVRIQELLQFKDSGNDGYMGLMYHMQDALQEANMSVSIATPNPQLALFSRSYYNTIQKLDHTKVYDFCFIGSIQSAPEHRKWVLAFVKQFFTSKSLFVNTDKGDWPSLGDFDKTGDKLGFCPKEQENNQSRRVQYRRVEDNKFYFESMCKSEFVLCPAGDSPWSFRWYEAIMCGAIPLLEDAKHSYRTPLESKIGFTYALAKYGKPRFIEAAIQHNNEKFVKYHLLSKT